MADNYFARDANHFATIGPRQDTPNDFATRILAAALSPVRKDPRDAYQYAKKLTDLMGFTPLGIPQAAYAAGNIVANGYRNSSPGQMAGGVGMAALAALPMPLAKAAAQEIKQGIKAYHGSPHLFDKFDAAKIGTGEGAQVYGHGLYFAEHPDTATAYREALAGMVDNPKRNDRLTELAKAMETELRPGGGYRQFKDQKGRDLAAEYDRIMEERAADKGHMYEVNIKAHPDHFLDWDKPLTEQPQHIQDFAKSIAVPNDPKRSYAAMRDFQQGSNRGYTVTGSTLHSVMTDYGMDAAGQRALTQKMQEAGIPGIKYLDQGSRGTGKGTRNYVVFNPDLVNILRRYAIPAAAVGGTGAAAMGQSPDGQY